GGGGAQPDAGTSIGGGGQPDAGSGGGGGQPDAGGAVAGHDECAGLGPGTVGQPSASVAIPATDYENWFPGATDGSGTVALMMTGDTFEPSLRIRLFQPSGAERGAYRSAQVTLGEAIVGQLQGVVVSYYDTVYARGKVGGIWIDHSGNAGAEFLALENVPSPPYLLLTPRVGNGFFAARNPGPPTTAAWIGQFDAMGEGTAPPDWLMARPVTRLPV